MNVRLPIVSLLIAAACAAAGVATAGTGFKVTFQGQSRSAKAGSAWAFYIQAWQNNRPWQGTATVDMQTRKGRIVDDVGRYPFNGNLLLGYQWNQKDRGLLILKVVYSQNGRTVGQTSYPVSVT